MKHISILQLVVITNVLLKVQSNPAHPKNLRNKDSFDEESNELEDSIYEDRLLDIQYRIDGNMTTIYYNESYSRTYFNGDHDYTQVDDYQFNYDHTYNNEEYDEMYGNNKESEEMEDEPPDEGSFMGKVLSLQSKLDTLFSTSPFEWNGNQWGLFLATFGSIFVLVLTAAFCCFYSARECSDTFDKCVGDREDETLLEDHSKCEEASIDDDMVYIKLSPSGPGKK